MLARPRPASAPGGAAGPAGRRVTNGGDQGTSGGAALERIGLIAFAAIALLAAIANTQTVDSDRAEIGLPPLGWEVWVWELSSAAAFLALLWPTARLVRAVRPIGWAPRAALLAAGSMLFSAAHVLIMFGLRKAIYLAAGRDYDFFHGRPFAVFFYEYRKDVVAYVGLVALLLLVSRLTAAAPAAAPAQPDRIEVKDGARTLWLRPDEIVFAEAAGNYVELHTMRGAVLARATLAAMEAELAPHGFARIHRSRLVRRAAIAELRSTASGDFELVLEGGHVVAGSRRFRDRLDSAPAIR